LAHIPASVVHDEPARVQSVQVGTVLDLDVVQQPGGEANYVSTRDGELTEFAAVSQQGNIGLLAHNYLSGRDFSRLKMGQEVNVFYNNGQTEQFVITQILRYQALDPKNPYSSFRNMDDPDEILNVGQMFDRVYQGKRHITFQTCIAKNGVSSWGRLFILAEPSLQQIRFDPMGLMVRRERRYIPVK
jgi:hypothetical protein